MKRRILLVDDEIAVLLTLKAVLEINGFDVDTAASARDAKLKLKNRQYAMVITDMRMENDIAGAEVIQAARRAEYHPALALLTAFPVAEEDWQEFDTDKVEVLMKPMQIKVLLQQIENLLDKHEAKLEAILASLKNGRVAGAATSNQNATEPPTKKAVAKTSAAKKIPVKKTTVKKTAAKKLSAKKAPLKNIPIKVKRAR